MLTLYLLINHTRVGRSVRAGANNAAMASAYGVKICRPFMLAFGFYAMLAGFAGALVAPILSVEPGTGDNLRIRALAVIANGVNLRRSSANAFRAEPDIPERFLHVGSAAPPVVVSS